MTSLGEASGPRLSRLGRYELITRIGEGGMAEVQLAIQRGPAGFEKLVVVKLVHERLAAERAFVNMLLDEARVAAMLKHPNVVDIYDLGQADGRYFIAMEYLEGEPLLAVLRAGREGKRLDPLSTGRLIADTAEGLDAAHELRTFGGEPIELVHHDVSLGNIVVLYNGQVKLVDFGVAKAAQSTAPVGKVQGKFSYMAPEKLRGGAGDRRSDIFSLGVVAWEAMTLRRLFKGGNDSDTMKQVLEMEIPRPSAVNGDVPADFDPILMKALERDPELRYATARDLARDLEEVLREHKYGGKNELIARYMQATFEHKITARKKLLQEVSSQGGASAEVLDAAFSEPGLASGSPVSHQHSGEFSVKFRTSSQLPAVTPTDDPSRPMRAEGSQVGPLRSPRLARPTGQILADQPEVPLEGGGTTANRGGRTKLYVALGAGLAAAAALVIVVLASGREPGPSAGGLASERVGDGAGEHAGVRVADSTDGAEPRAPVGIGDAGVPAGPPPGEPGPALVAAPTSEASDVPAAPAATTDARDEERGSHGPVGNTARSRGPSAQELFKTGMQAYVQGNTRAAIVAFRRAVQAQPRYAAAWRALGISHEKLGEWGKAKSAFQRYLELAPSASDASQIRERLANL